MVVISWLGKGVLTISSDQCRPLKKGMVKELGEGNGFMHPAVIKKEIGTMSDCKSLL